MAPNGDGPPRSNPELRRATVYVILGLLILVIAGNFVDDELLGNRYSVDPNFLLLVGGMVTALLAPDLIDRFRS